MPENGRLDPPEPGPGPRSPILRAGKVADWQEGRATLAEAQRLAEEIRVAAEAEAQEAKRQAVEDGRRAGAQEAAQLLIETAAKLDQDLEAIERRLADLVMEVVEQILGEFDDRELLLRATRHALSMLRRDRQLTVYVAPSDAADLRRRLEQDLAAEDPLAVPIVQGDSKLAPGSCVIASAVGFVEAGVEAQLAAFRAALRADSKDPE